MQDAHFLAVKPLSVKTTRASCADAVILNVMRHNARELQAEIGIGAESGIDPSRIHLNVTLHGAATADGVASAARDAMREHGIVAPRKNATLGIEIVVSLPAGLRIDQLAYFRDAMDWSQQRYRVPLLSAILHNDESHPHLHLVLLPVRGGKLVGSELLGNRATMKAMQKDFHDQVAKQYGLRMPAAKKRHSAADRAAGISLLRDTLQANSGLTDRAIDALLVPHAKNPEPLLLALGLAMPAAPVKGSFIATMTRKVRAENPNRSFTKFPIGDFGADIAASFGAENEMSYALLGLPISAPNISPQSADQSTTGQAPADHHRQPARGLKNPLHTPVESAADTVGHGKPAGPLLSTQEASAQSTTSQAALIGTTTDTAQSTATDMQHAAGKPASASPVPTSAPAALAKAASSKPATKRADRPASTAATSSLSCNAVPEVQAGHDIESNASPAACCGTVGGIAGMKTRYSTAADQPNEPVAKVAPLGELHQDATEPEQHPAPAMRPDDGATAQQDTPALDVADDRDQPLTRPVRADLERQQGEQSPPTAGDDYQRQHDDNQPAEHWDADRGEFVRPTSSRPEARASPVHMAPDSMHQLHA